MTLAHYRHGLLLALLGLLASLPAGCASTGAARVSAPCPQPRQTVSAPADYLGLRNPLARDQVDMRAASIQFQLSCAGCHGRAGNGQGSLHERYQPPPRNFSCASTVRDIPDGQWFWVIRHGSPGTGMPPFPSLQDEEIWQLVHYLRTFAE